jgi:hypothetical protein
MGQADWLRQPIFIDFDVQNFTCESMAALRLKGNVYVNAL